MVQFSGEAIIGTTHDGIITNWNPEAERVYCHNEEIIGKPDRLITPQDRTNEACRVLAKIRSCQDVERLKTM